MQIPATLSLKGRALRCLASREHSRLEMERKLASHETEPGELARVLDDLQAKGFISEQRVVESVVNRRAARHGASRIRQELLGKGIDPQTVQHCRPASGSGRSPSGKGSLARLLPMPKERPSRCAFWRRGASAWM